MSCEAKGRVAKIWMEVADVSLSSVILIDYSMGSPVHVRKILLWPTTVIAI